jgi:hypothetical protein
VTLSAFRVPDVGHVRVIARTELRRRLRSVLGSPRAIAFVVAGLFGFVAAAAAGVGAFFLGRAVAGGGTIGGGPDQVPLVPIVRVVAAGTFGFVAAIVSFRVAAGRSSIDAAPGVLTTVPHRDVLAGLVVTEAASAFAYVGPLAAVVGVGAALGAGTPVPAIVAPAVAGLLTGVAAAVGFAAGLAVRAVVVRVPTVGRYRTVLLVLAGAAYAGLLATGRLAAVTGPAIDVLGATPVGWVGDLLLVAAGASLDPLAGLAGLGAIIVAVPLALGAGVALAGRVWFADPVPTGGDQASRTVPDAGDEAEPGLAWAGPTVDRPVWPFDRTTGAVARIAWLRARRAPITLVYVLYPLFLLAAVASPSEGGLLPLPSVLPVLVALSCAWAAGSAFALNPLGGEGAVLATTLTSPVSGRQFLRGRVLAGAVPGVPAAATLTLATGLLTDLAAPVVVGVAVGAAGLTAVSGGVAAGVGVVFPRFDAVSVLRSREAVLPSLAAFLFFSLCVVACGLPLVAAHPALAGALGGVLGIPPAGVVAGGTVASLALATGLGTAGYRFAVSRFDGYTL